MGTKHLKERDHDQDLRRIDAAASATLWEGRLSAIEMVQASLRDLPTERTVEHLVGVLDRLASDQKWEVRKAVVPALVETDHPAARNVVERLTEDENQWVRQAAERAKRKLSRVTTSAEKRDKRAQYAFDLIKDLRGESPERLYDVALHIAEQYYEELAGDTAHELNTYRAVMEGLLGELEHEVLAGNTNGLAAAEIVGKIKERFCYLKILVNGLLEYTKETELEFLVHPVKPMVTEALGLAKASARDRVGDVVASETVVIPDDLELEVCRPRVVQALINILSNSFEALEGKDTTAALEITATTNGADRLVLKVRDNGCGMDPSQVENAKKRFRSLKKERGGIGLGLPLALKVIEREHGGRLDIESDLGTGTTVTVELPLRREART